LKSGTLKPLLTYAGGFYKFLKKTRSGKEFIDNIRPKSDKSGAAMRSCPIGVFPSEDEVISRCSIQAAITHNTVDGKNAAIAAALMAHYFIYNLGKKSELPEYLCEHVAGNWAEPWVGEVGSRGWMSVRAAITSLMMNDSLSAILRSSIKWGGDTDTIAAIALAAGSCSKDIEQDIPEVLLQGLEHGKYGIHFLHSLDKKLMKLCKKNCGRRK
jgi:ADP-ribosyl-[dinitrogen reductase] hydrolase